MIFQTKKIAETRNYVLEEVKHDSISEEDQKVRRAVNYS